MSGVSVAGIISRPKKVMNRSKRSYAEATRDKLRLFYGITPVQPFGLPFPYHVHRSDTWQRSYLLKS
jgi:hypothetical protein